MNLPQNKRTFHIDKIGLLTLLAANGLAIWQFSAHGGSALQVLWIYWLQSVIIGAVNVVRILYSPLNPGDASVSINGKPFNAADSTARGVRVFLAGFFTVHYGMFHLGYFIFLIALGTNAPVYINGNPVPEKIFSGSLNPKLILASGAVFALHHVLTYLIERNIAKTNTQQPPSLAQIMLRPYVRIVPMHLIIIFGPLISIKFGDASIFLAFMTLKTLADIILFVKGTGHPGSINPAHPQPITTNT